MNTIKEITDETFEKEVLRSSTPCVVDFWADWCPPCKAIEPVLEQLHKAYAGRVVFKKMDVGQNPVTPMKFGIRSIPALLFVTKGDVSQTLVGSQTKKAIEDALKDLFEERTAFTGLHRP